MIFEIQRYLEDYFARRSLIDNDQYAIKLANAFMKADANATESEICAAFRRIRTIFYKTNSSLGRGDFEANLVRLLSQRFQKKIMDSYFQVA